jgi:branched-chain amino acid transport system substrate-binding protein
MKKIILSGVAMSFAAALSATSALAEITIATAGPITGGLAALGEQYRQGATLAVADINAAGGINGEKVLLEIGDDSCDPKQAVAVANQLASKGVTFVAGHLCSGSSIPASKVYEEEGILQITPASTNPKFTDEGGWNVARACGRDDVQGAFASAYIAKAFAGKKIAVIDDKSAYGKGVADETKKGLAAAGMTVVLSEQINAGEKDFSALASKIKAEGIDVIYWGGYHTEGALIMKQLAEQGSAAQMVAPDSLAENEFATIAGDAAKNVVFSFPPDARNMATAKDVVEKFKAGGYDPVGYTLYTYASFQMYAQAAAATKSTDPKTLATWLRAGNPMQTVVGEIKLDAKGDVINPEYAWYRFVDGKYQQDDSIGK